MRFDLLGPLRVLGDDGPLPLGQPRQRAILARLLIDAEHVVPVDRLVEDVWGDHPPARPAGALHAYISNLRQVLEPGRAVRAPATVIVSEAPGYVLRVGPHEVDALVFEQLVADGQRCAQHDSAAALASFDAALALWRGPVLDDFSDEPWRTGSAVRLDELRASALEGRFAALLDLGRHAPAIPDLVSATGESPLRERLWELLMVALYRSGRQADALAAFQRVRTVLGEELGLDPGPALVDLERRVLQHDPALAAPVAVAVPSPTATEPPTVPVIVHRPLVGRTTELERLRRIVDGIQTGHGAALVVSGEAGVGKTRLVEVGMHEAADRRRAAGADAPAVAWGRCVAGEAAPTAWPWLQIAAALGPGGSRLAKTLTVASARSGDLAAARTLAFDAAATELLAVAVAAPTIFVIDDAQWADEATHHIVQLLLTRLDHAPLLLILTVRDGETGSAMASTMAALARSRMVERIELDGLDDPAIALYAEQMTGRAPDRAATDMLARRTGGNAFYLTELLRLHGSRPLSTPAAIETGVPTSVRDVIRARTSALPRTAEQVLPIAAVIGRTFDWRVVAEMTGLDDETALDGFDAAIVSGLIENGDTPTRLAFSHDLVRETLYAELSAPRQAHLHARAVTALLAMHGADPARVNEVAAHAWAGRSMMDAGDVAQHLVTAAVADEPLSPDRAESHLRRALQLIDDMPPGATRDALEASASGRLAPLVSLYRANPTPDSPELLARARDVQVRLGRVGPETVQTLISLAAQAQQSHQWAEADAIADELLRIAEEGSVSEVSVAYDCVVALTALHRGECRRAVEYFDRALQSARLSHAPDLVEVLGADPTAVLLAMTALAKTLAGDFEGGRSLAAEATPLIDRQLTVRDTSTLNYLSWRAQIDGDHADALHLDERAALAESLDDATPAVTRPRLLSAWALAHQGQPERALTMIEELLAEGDPYVTDRTSTVFVHADILLTLGRPADALYVLRNPSTPFAEIDAVWLAELHRLSGQALAAAGAESDQCLAAFDQAIAVASEQGAGAFELNASRARAEYLAGRHER